MKIRRFDLLGALIIAAMAGAMIAATPHKVMGVSLILVAYGWSIGYFTDDHEEENERGLTYDRSSTNKRLSVARRKSI